MPGTNSRLENQVLSLDDPWEQWTLLQAMVWTASEGMRWSNRMNRMNSCYKTEPRWYMDGRWTNRPVGEVEPPHGVGREERDCFCFHGRLMHACLVPWLCCRWCWCLIICASAVRGAELKPAAMSGKFPGNWHADPYGVMICIPVQAQAFSPN